MFPRWGSVSSNVWEPLVPRTGNPGAPGFQDWEALVRRFGNRWVLEQGNPGFQAWEGSKIGKHWLEGLGT